MTPRERYGTETHKYHHQETPHAPCVASPSLISLSALVREEQEDADKSNYGAIEVSDSSVDEDRDVQNNSLSPEKKPSYSHTGSTMALCLCTLTHSYLLISVFPYAGFMAIELIPSVDEETAGSYAGLIAAMFMIGRTISSYAWGKIADTYGRTFVLYLSLAMSGLFTLLFGMAPTFGVALFWRCCLGLGNGIVGTTKTAVSELARGDEKLENQAMGLVMGMWGGAFLISPALSGWLAEPVRQYPELTSELPLHLREYLASYPFLLPNLLGAVLCLCSMAAVIIYVEETLPTERRRSAIHIPSDIVIKVKELIPSLSGKSAGDDEVLPLRKPEIMIKEDHDDNKEATMASLWARDSLRRHLLVYWGYSLVAIAVEEVFPLLCISQQAGLGLTEGSIGKILSLSGLLYALFQYLIYSTIVKKLGIYGSIRVGLLVSAPLVSLIPLTILFNKTPDGATQSSSLTWGAWVFSGTLLAIYRIFGSIFFTSITVAANRTVPASHRGTMNGFSMLGGSAVKGLGPIVAGCLFAFSVSSGTFPQGVGIVMPFALIGISGFLVALSSFTLTGEGVK